MFLYVISFRENVSRFFSSYSCQRARARIMTPLVLASWKKIYNHYAFTILITFRKAVL